MLTIIFLVLAALGGALIASIVTYRIAWKRGRISGARYGYRYGVRIVRDPAFLVAEYEKRHPEEARQSAA